MYTKSFILDLSEAEERLGTPYKYEYKFSYVGIPSLLLIQPGLTEFQPNVIGLLSLKL